MNTKNEVFEYLIDQLRQQVNNSQCEDLAHEVLSLKNQLRDASALVKELYKTISELQQELAVATGDVEAFKRSRKGGYRPEQSGCRKEDAHGCEHEWRVATFYGARVSSTYCRKCGVAKPEECEHEWVEFHGLFIAEGDPRNEPGYTFCRKCGLKEYSRKCEHEWSYVMGDGPGFYECDVCGARSETLPYDLRWLA